MVLVDNWLTESGLDAKVILQVHDELVLEVREDLVNPLVTTSFSSSRYCFILVPVSLKPGLSKSPGIRI